MDFPFKNSIVTAEITSGTRTEDLLRFNSGAVLTVIDLRKFDKEMRRLGGEEALIGYLTGEEQNRLSRLTSGKRRREWLGGRFAAKLAAAEIISRLGRAVSWFSLGILADADGRPFLAGYEKEVSRPDVSISHSGDLAAAMAAREGLCGIDVQKVTARVVKVRERFCSPDEERLLYDFFKVAGTRDAACLTRLWSAKETLRKIAHNSSLPGFLDLVLTDIEEDSFHGYSAAWKFILDRRVTNGKSKSVREKFSVTLWVQGDYTLAATTIK